MLEHVVETELFCDIIISCSGKKGGNLLLNLLSLIGGKLNGVPVLQMTLMRSVKQGPQN